MAILAARLGWRAGSRGTNTWTVRCCLCRCADSYWRTDESQYHSLSDEKPRTRHLGRSSTRLATVGQETGDQSGIRCKAYISSNRSDAGLS